jgi:hypothetical protein
MPLSGSSTDEFYTSGKCGRNRPGACGEHAANMQQCFAVDTSRIWRLDYFECSVQKPGKTIFEATTIVNGEPGSEFID